MGESEFVQRIGAEGGDEQAGCLIYTKLLDWIYVTGFTPYPEDNLCHIYGIAEEERDEDMILEILQHLKMKPPSTEALGVFGAVDTPIQIARLVRQVRLNG